jgi:hypothetical protein
MKYIALSHLTALFSRELDEYAQVASRKKEDNNTVALEVCNVLSTTVEELQAKIELLPKFESWGSGELTDWHFSSVSEKDTAILTDEHIAVLLQDFIIIPRWKEVKWEEAK